MSRIKQFSEDRFALIVTAAFLACSAFALVHHEMWRDEMEFWNIARDSPSLGSLFHNMRYEGYPALWFLVLYALNSIVSSPVAMQWLHLAIAAGSVYIFVRFSPFTRLQRTLFAFGYFPLYEYAVISRPYQLTVFLLFLFCALYPKRFENFPAVAVILVLLANTSVYGAIFVMAVCAALALEKPFAYWGSGFVIGLGLLISAITMKPPRDTGVAVGWNFRPNFIHARDVLDVIPRAFFPIPSFTLHFWNSSILDGHPFSTVIAFVLAIVLLVWIISILARSRVALAMYAVGTLGLLSFFYSKYIGYLRHHGFLFVLFLAALWIMQVRERDRIPRFHTVVLTAILVIQIVGGAAAIIMDYQYTFSEAQVTARYIHDEGLDRLTIVGDIDYAVATLSGFLNKQIYYPAGHRYGSFVIWNRDRTDMFPDAKVFEEARALNKDNTGNVLIVLTRPLSEEIQNRYGAMEIKRFEGAVDYLENYYLYRFR